MEVVNDARLMQLVREPSRELLPAARRASVVQPLVVLLAFLPGLIGFWNRSLDDATCRQGLIALDVATGDRPMDWIVTATREAMDRPTHSFPLATLLTAVGLRVELFSSESRLLLVSYLGSAMLLVCLSCLGTKVGGRRFALLVVCLACGHREFLALSESLPPVTLPLAFAALSFRAMLVHQAAGQLLSWSLMACSLLLAACWLSGGELALASWGVLLVASVFSTFSQIEPVARRSFGRLIRHRVSNLLMAVASLAVVTSISVAIVVGWQLAFSETIRLPNVAANSVWLRRIWPLESRVPAAAHDLIQTMGAWLGFTLLGVMQLVRVRTSQRENMRRQGALFLVCWSAVAWISWWVNWPMHHGDMANSSAWAGFLVLPLLFLAAWGLDAVLRREFGLGTVFGATLVTVGIVSAPNWIVRLPSTVTNLWIALFVLTAAVVIGVGLIVVRRIAQSESHTRLAMLTCVSLLVLADLASGLFARRRLADDERELQAFRRQLLTETQPDECWLMTDETSPARLRFFLRSLWRGVPVREANDWESVLVGLPRQAIARPVDSVKSRTIVVTWGSAKLPAEEAKRRGQALAQATTPHFFQGRLLKGYRWIERSDGPVTR